MAKIVTKFCIAGFGGRGKLIGRRLVDLAFNVVGVYDSNPSQLTDAPFPRFTNLSDLLKLDFKALVIATWPSSHAQMAEKALEHGLDVLIEKPMGATLDQSLRIVQAQRRAGRLVVGGYVERVNPAITKLTEIADLAEITRSREIRVGLAPPATDATGVLSDLASRGIPLVQSRTESR